MTNEGTGAEHGAEPEATVDEVLAKIEESPLGPLLADEQAMNKMMFDLLAKSDDPVVSEMGSELSKGNVSLQDLGSIPEYRAAVESGFDRIGEIDLNSMSQQLDQLMAEQQEQDAAEAAEEEEEPEELWQGMWTDEPKRR